MTVPDSQAPRANLHAIGGALRLDAATAEVMVRFAASDVQARVLKGPAIARWLYPNGPRRTYNDCDLLIRPDDLDRAAEVLASLGYTRHFDDRAMPEWWREHAGEWVDEIGGVTVDVHRTLPGIGVDPSTAWARLTAGSELVVVANESVPALPLPGRALHVVLHAAQHGVLWSQPMRDLEQALLVAGDDLWSEATSLAQSLDATDAFATGLRMIPAGHELATRLGLPTVSSVDAYLRAVSAPAEALTFERFVTAPGAPAKAALLWRKLVPPASFIRHWDPRAAASRTALIRAYLRRPVWILRSAPRGFSAWRQARRTVGGPPR